MGFCETLYIFEVSLKQKKCKALYEIQYKNYIIPHICDDI